jgi:hypothetical protein
MRGMDPVGLVSKYFTVLLDCAGMAPEIGGGPCGPLGRLGTFGMAPGPDG